jgi:hypothetical protein
MHPSPKEVATSSCGRRGRRCRFDVQSTKQTAAATVTATAGTRRGASSGCYREVEEAATGLFMAHLRPSAWTAARRTSGLAARSAAASGSTRVLTCAAMLAGAASRTASTGATRCRHGPWRALYALTRLLGLISARHTLEKVAEHRGRSLPQAEQRVRRATGVPACSAPAVVRWS